MKELKGCVVVFVVGWVVELVDGGVLVRVCAQSAMQAATFESSLFLHKFHSGYALCTV